MVGGSEVSEKFLIHFRKVFGEKGGRSPFVPVYPKPEMARKWSKSSTRVYFLRIDNPLTGDAVCWKFVKIK